MLEELRQRYNVIRDRHDDVTLRIHRALSWAEKGLSAKESDDPDAACIFFWIAFNSMYAVGRTTTRRTKSSGTSCNSSSRWATWTGSVR